MSTAIVVPVYNQANYTRNCFRSIAMNTKDYHIVWVDNASTLKDGAKIKDSLDKDHINYTLLQNESNEGFIKATNRGIQWAIDNNFEYIVLLNNDTILTPNWLDQLIWHYNHYPKGKVGAVGPIASPSISFQAVNNLSRSYSFPPYDGVSLNDYANLLYKANQHQAITSKMIAFFCTLFRIEIFKTLGLLDIDYGVGLVDDDDFCYRMRKAEYLPIIALDTYVFHYSRTTFTHLGINPGDVIAQNWELFRKKHGVNKA